MMQTQVGSLVVSHITSYTATWISLVTLLTVHLGMNYAAVRAVQMTSLNRQRANIVFSTLLESDLPHAASDTATTTTPTPTPAQANHPPHWHICTPAQAAKQERIFTSRGNILKWTTAQTVSTVGTCQIGLSLHQFITSHPDHTYSVTAATTTAKGSTTALKTPLPLPALTELFTHEPYLLFLSRSSNNQNSLWHATILLKPTSTTKDQLKAWMHALLCARLLSISPAFSPSTSTSPSTQPHPTTTTTNPDPETTPNPETSPILKTLTHTLNILNADSRFERYLSALAHAGWDLDVAALETRSGRRVSFSSSSPSSF